MADTTQGLYKKFRVERTDGKSAPGQKHSGCRYFVIDLDHDPIAPHVLHEYADRCHAELCRDLRDIADALLAKPTPTTGGEG